MFATTRHLAKRTSDQLGAGARTLLDKIARHWVAVLLGATIVMAGALATWQNRFPVAAGEEPQSCWPQSLVTLTTPMSCVDSLLRVTESLLRLGGPSLPTKDAPSRWAYEEPGKPQLFVWADNAFVDMYTLLFMSGCAAGYMRRARGDQRSSSMRRRILRITVLTCLCGALADHIENFWLLAHIGATADYLSEATVVAFFTAWKFRLFTVNVLLLAWWAFFGARRQSSASVS